MPLPGQGEGFFTITKNALVSGFLALPIILITITGFLGTATCNLGMIILFLGQVLVVPFVQFILDFFRNRWPLEYILGGKAPFFASNQKICALSPVDTTDDMRMPFIPYWLAQVAFFTSFVVSNGVALYTMEATGNVKEAKVENRKAQALTSILLTVFILGAAVIAHTLIVQCATWQVSVFGAALFGLLGFSFFKLAEACGLRNADTFGIASRLTSFISSDLEFPYACVNITQTQ